MSAGTLIFQMQLLMYEQISVFSALNLSLSLQYQLKTKLSILTKVNLLVFQIETKMIQAVFTKQFASVNLDALSKHHLVISLELWC